MRSPQLWLSATMVALVACTAQAADPSPDSGVGSFSPAVQTWTMKGSASDAADIIPVFHGRFRPYWRGYYHGTTGVTPRPNLFYGPFITSRYYGFRPGLAGTATVARPAYFAAGPVYYAAAPVYSFEPPANYCRELVAPVAVAGETSAPPLAFVPDARMPVQAIPGAATSFTIARPAQMPSYAAYGESGTARPIAKVEKNPK